jgi:hypothetical protein
VGADLEGPERPEQGGPRPRGLRLGYRDPALQGVVVAVLLFVMLGFFVSAAVWVLLLIAALYGVAWAALISWRNRAGG